MIELPPLPRPDSFGFYQERHALLEKLHTMVPTATVARIRLLPQELWLEAAQEQQETST